MSASRLSLRNKASKILANLKQQYPHAKCSLHFKNPFQLLIATILSAQCTDQRVNRVTETLFRKYSTPQAFAGADLKQLEQDIRSTGFYKNKARSIQSCSRELVDSHAGKVPPVLEEMIKLRGVGRKTANVVLGVAFGKDAVVVDTHVGRLSSRLGLTSEKDPVKIEFELMEIFPKKDWTRIAHLFIDHGRAVCKAPTPKCEICKLTTLCDYYRTHMRVHRGGIPPPRRGYPVAVPARGFMPRAGGGEAERSRPLTHLKNRKEDSFEARC